MAEGLKALPATYRFTHNQSGKVYFGWPVSATSHTTINAAQISMLRVWVGIYCLNTMGVHLESSRRTNTWLVLKLLEGECWCTSYTPAAEY